MVLQTYSKYFVGCIYLGLHNQINAVMMCMCKCYWISTCACIYLMEVYFIMAACQHSFWTGKFINFWCLMISYHCWKYANWLLNNCRSGNSKVQPRQTCMGSILALLRTGPYIGYIKIITCGAAVLTGQLDLT